MILDFKINDYLMGSEFEADYEDVITIDFSVKGTGNIKKIEILKWDYINGDYNGMHPNLEIFEIVSLAGSSLDYYEGTLTDMLTSDSVYYYMRILQQDKVANHEVWGWTSPIWINVRNAPTAVNNVLSQSLGISLTSNLLDGGEATSIHVSSKEPINLKLKLFNVVGQLMMEDGFCN